MGKKETRSIYLAGLLQGVTLVAFPAASTIFTNPHDFNFSSATYGSIFLPQAFVSILASLWSTKLTQSLGIKPVFLLGLAANILSMALLALSSFFMHNEPLALAVLLSATTCLGLGFGLTVPAVNTMAALFFPAKTDAAILYMNACLGLGTALAPLFIVLFVHLGIWWGLPLMLMLAMSVLLLYSMPLSLAERKITARQGGLHLPARFWLFAAFALLYGIVETLNGNWLSIFMIKDAHASPELASFALTLFWGMVTIGRLFFASIEKYFPEELAFRLLPIVTMLAFILITTLATTLTSNRSLFTLFSFGLAGFGCSAILPLIISFGQKQLTAIQASVAGGIVSFYLMGYGIAAFGAGPLQTILGISLKDIYLFGAIISIAMHFASRYITKNIRG